MAKNFISDIKQSTVPLELHHKNFGFFDSDLDTKINL